MSKTPLPFKRGDHVVTADGEIGRVVRMCQSEHMNDTLLNAWFTVRPDWDQPSYGEDQRWHMDDLGDAAEFLAEITRVRLSERPEPETAEGLA